MRPGVGWRPVAGLPLLSSSATSTSKLRLTGHKNSASPQGRPSSNMKSELFVSAFAKSRYRFAAVLLLLWAVVDLTVPVWSQELHPEHDQHVSRPEAAMHVIHTSACRNSPAAMTTFVVSTAAPDSDEIPAPDCWCCCAHVSPTSPAALAEVAVLSQAHAQLPENLVQASKPLFFHPPRS